MGSSVEANCECGYHASSLVGGGMANFEAICYFPCLCEQCREIVEVNLLAEEPSCPKCDGTKVKAYDDPTLAGSPGPETVAEWNAGDRIGRELILTNGSYLCPKCNQTALRFDDGQMCWD